MKTILITGNRGFAGSALTKKLENLGYKVLGFDIEDGDIANKDSLQMFKDASIDHIIHLAAKMYVPDSWLEPFDFYKTNTTGTLSVLEFCRKYGCSLTYVSSYVYGNPMYLPIDEFHPLKPFNPYCHTKIVAEDICNYYVANFGIKCTIFRPFNLYGPGQNKAFLIPLVIDQVMSKDIETIEVMDLTPKRDFLYIDDFIDALILSIDGRPDFYNIGSGYSLSVEDIIKTIIKKAGVKKNYRSLNNQRINEVFDVVSNISKISRELNWVPKIDFETGIERCING